MKKKELDFLKEITDLLATSGNEDSVRHYFKERYERIADKVETDGLGSLMAYRGNVGPRVLLAGHMDEVGFIVRSVGEDGFIRISRCGFFFESGTLSQHFVIQTEKGNVPALCSLGPATRNNELPKIDDLVLDIGCKSRKEAEALGVRVGDFIVPEGNFHRLGAKGEYLVNKAWDNRIGCAVAYKVMDTLKDEKLNSVLICGGSVQEEVGCRGAQTMASRVNADIAFSLDIGTADDMPKADHEGSRLGQGPELCYMDSLTISNRKLLRFVENVARECNIPYQTAIMRRGGTDASKFQMTGAGIPVAVINIPCRYAHTPTSMIHYDDYANAVKLMSEVVKRLDSDTVAELRQF